MHGVLERRRQYLRLMRQFTVDQGYFTVTDIQKTAGVPRSTAQDWVLRLMREGCVICRNRQQGRSPARYATRSAVPSSACRRIFTTVDQNIVDIYHECRSGACAAFCGYHHRLAGGALVRVCREGALLRERAVIGEHEMPIGLYPLPAVGVTGVAREGDSVIQTIRCIGGPAYSLTDMIAEAQGVEEVTITRQGPLVEGRVRTSALAQVTIGIDDTDLPERGATFALALALLQHLSCIRGVFPIGHHIAMLCPRLPGKTAGNSCGAITLAVEPKTLHTVRERALSFTLEESDSPSWGLAIRNGILVPPGLREYGGRCRCEVITREEAQGVAERFGIDLHGGNGVIGALAAVSLVDLPTAILLDPAAGIPVVASDQ